MDGIIEHIGEADGLTLASEDITVYCVFEKLRLLFERIYIRGSRRRFKPDLRRIFSAETAPDMPVAEAVRMSMPIPLLF